MTTIKKVAVLGSGTMGAGIAAACANAGCDVVLLDLEKETCDQAKIRLAGGKSPVIADQSILDRIYTGSIASDMQKVSDCQWICEAVIEDLEIKRKCFGQVEQMRSDGSIVSTNTSGIPLRDIDEGMPERLRRNVAVTHFFNPVHIMKLVELVPGEATDPSVIDSLANFLGNDLGKGVVYAKDTVNFIGNRVGCMWMFAGLNMAEKAIVEDGLTTEVVDALMSEPVGIPATGLLGLLDLVGLDVHLNVGRNLQRNLPENDYARRFLKISDTIQAMHDRGQLGRKSGGGFYRLIRHDDGTKSMEVFDLADLDWRESREVELPENEKNLPGLFASDSANGRFVRDLMATTLCYTADLVPEIADDIVNVDRGMRWGYAWERGPFELIDKIGAQHLIDLVNEHGMSMPNMLQVLIDSGETSFYRNDGSEFLSVDGDWLAVPG